MLRIFGTAALSDVLGDLVVYRSLVPCDPRLPDVGTLRRELGLADGALPRKTEPSYARVVAEILRHGDRLRGGGSIGSVIVVGDTIHNDGTAFENLCGALEVPGAALICHETDDPECLEERGSGDRTTYLANRWRLLDGFDARLARHGIEVGPATVVVVDIDKTAIGARGRNHAAIDAARFAAVRRTAADVLGSEVDPAAATAAYDRLNQPPYHPFTTDNQDFVAYLCLLAGSGRIGIDDLAEGILGGRWSGFAGLLEEVSGWSSRLPDGLRTIHRQVTTAVAAGDPTPFKRFRAAEYLETVSRMGTDTDDDLGAVLAGRITITHEVLRWAREWSRRGALLFGLSDKPDEASLPSPALAAAGYEPLHRTTALVVGEAVID